MILLGLGVSIFLYTHIHIFQNWQSILYIVCSIALLLVLVYLVIVLRMRHLSVKDKQPEENDVLATASREPMRVSDWEAVIAYSAAPAKQKGIRRVTGKKAEVSASVPLTYAAFTPAESPEQEQDEQKAMAADAITSFFRENTKLPQSPIKSVPAFEKEKVAERKSFPEPLRVKSPFVQPAADPDPVDDGSEFESLSFRVVRDKSASTAVAAPAVDAMPEPTQAPKTSVSAIITPMMDTMAEHTAQAPKTSVTKEARESSEAEAPLYKVHKAALSASDGQVAPAPKGISERNDAVPSAEEVPFIPVLESEPNSIDETPEPFATQPAPAAEDVAPSLQGDAIYRHLQPAMDILPVDEPAAVPMVEPTATVEDVTLEEGKTVGPEADGIAESAGAFEGTSSSEVLEEAITEVEDALENASLPEAFELEEAIAEVEKPSEEAFLPERIRAEDTIAEAEDVLEEASLPEAFEPEAPETEEFSALPEVSAPENDSEPVPAEESLPIPAEDSLQSAFAQGMAELNALVASRAYRSAQTLIFDLLRMAYTPTEEEKKKLLLIMKLLKEKETRTDADARTR